MSTLLALTAAMMFATGSWLLMQRRLSRIIIGVGLLGHGANLLLLLSAGGRGAPPLVDQSEAEAMADPLPHALALTAIVITFGITAFLLALGYRSWRLTSDDEVEDDVEDRIVARHELADSDTVDEAEAEAAQAAEEGRR